MSMSKVRRTAIGLAAAFGSVVVVAPSAHAAQPKPAAVQQHQATVRPEGGITATVPNMFVRDCSYITRRCTGYYQTNGPYNPSVTSTYKTRWVWRWI